MAISILTATIATAGAFLPLFFLQGNIGSFIRPAPVVISLTLAASMAMSLTIIPIFRRWVGERRLARRASGRALQETAATSEDSAEQTPGLLGRPIQRLSAFYGRQIHRFLRRPR
ncbi:hypothetical protein LJK88_37795 [Paenibacillus sp. P26]|nr:hypothetical protein LJK88_37795 [Paenibacillus sp. P26]